VLEQVLQIFSNQIIEVKATVFNGGYLFGYQGLGV